MHVHTPRKIWRMWTMHVAAIMIRSIDCRDCPRAAAGIVVWRVHLDEAGPTLPMKVWVQITRSITRRVGYPRSLRVDSSRVALEPMAIQRDVRRRGCADAATRAKRR